MFYCNLYINYSIDRKTYFCTRCLKDFNHERFFKLHPDKCPNIVMEENLIDSLKSTGGFSKEIKRRHDNKLIIYAKKLEAEICAETSHDDSSQPEG